MRIGSDGESQRFHTLQDWARTGTLYAPHRNGTRMQPVILSFYNSQNYSGFVGLSSDGYFATPAVIIKKWIPDLAEKADVLRLIINHLQENKSKAGKIKWSWRNAALKSNYCLNTYTCQQWAGATAITLQQGSKKKHNKPRVCIHSNVSLCLEQTVKNVEVSIFN